MQIKKKLSIFLISVLMIFMFISCDAITPKFMDYDVSGYIKALLDSSYKAENEVFITYTHLSAEDALKNNNITGENGAIYFCNAFGIYPDDKQLLRFEEIVKKAYAQTKYTVKDEVKTDTGYTVTVEIQPLTIFRELTDKLEQVLDDIENGRFTVSDIESESNISSEGSADSEEEPQSDYDGESSNKENNETALSTNALDENSIFIEEVIRLCEEALEKTPVYDQVTTIDLDIRQSAEGELSLDTAQIKQIDVTVIIFAKSN